MVRRSEIGATAVEKALGLALIAAAVLLLVRQLGT
jgi:Flp pilus assembly pilin Flp